VSGESRQPHDPVEAAFGEWLDHVVACRGRLLCETRKGRPVVDTGRPSLSYVVDYVSDQSRSIT